jgi:hypothetical protein
MTEEVSIEVTPSIELLNALGATTHPEADDIKQLPQEHNIIEEDTIESRDGRHASTKKKSSIVIMFAIAFAFLATAAGAGYGVYTNTNRTDTSAALSFVEDECKEEGVPPDSVESNNFLETPSSFPTVVSTVLTTHCKWPYFHPDRLLIQLSFMLVSYLRRQPP